MGAPRWPLALLLAAAGLLAAPARAVTLVNAGFAEDLAGWSGTGTWAAFDVDGDPGSGSALLRAHELDSLSQCVPATPGAVDAGASVFVPVGQTGIANFGVSVSFFAAPDCAGFPFNLPLAVVIAPAGVWSEVPALTFPEVPGGAASARFRLGFLAFQGEFEAYFDAARVVFVPESARSGLVAAALALALTCRRMREGVAG